MYLLSVSDLFSGKIIQALCWTLVHSLWIGLLLTVATGLVMVATKKQSPVLRYNLLTGMLMAFIITMSAVFFYEWNTLSNTAPVPVSTAHVTGAGAVAVQDQVLQPLAAGPGFKVAVTDFLNRYATLIVMVWFFIVAFRCIQLAGGLYRLHQLKNDELSSPGEEWNEKLNRLMRQMNIKTPVRFFQSGIAKIPMVVGHLKPVILFPVGVLASLPQDEAEAILVHELAHIRRKDYLVNMVQSFADILFFFNPAVLWLSSLIRIERENCCDDIAVAQTSCKRNYINALVSFQEYHLSSAPYATALAGKKDLLLQRVKRMLYNNNKTLNGMEKTFLALCLIITTSLSVIFSQAQPATPKERDAQLSTNDSIPSILNRRFDPKDFSEGTTTIYTEKTDGVSHTLHVYKKEGVLYQLYDDVSDFKINGQSVPREQWGRYKKLMNEIKRAPEQAGIEDPVKDTAVADVADNPEPDNTITYSVKGYKVVTENDEIKEVYLEKDGSRLPESFIKKNKAYLLSSIDQQRDVSKREAEKKMADLDALNAENDRKLQDMKREKTELDRNLANINPNVNISDKSRKVENAAVVADQNTKVTVRKSVKDEKKHIITGITYSVNEKNAYDATYKDYEPSYDRDGRRLDLDKLTADFIDDLVKEKVIRGRDGLSYKMSSGELIVNGKAQSEALHRKLKDKYLKSPDWQLVYNWRM